MSKARFQRSKPGSSPEGPDPVSVAENGDEARISAFESRAGASSTRPSLFSPAAFSLHSHRLLLGYCVVAALSIAASQIMLGAFLLYWLATFFKNRRFLDFTALKDGTAVFLAPIAAWIGIDLLTSLTGMAPLSSLVDTAKSSFFLLLPFAVYSSCSTIRLSTREFLGRIEAYVMALIIGQCIAAVHTIGSEVVGQELRPAIPGALTESGQLVLVIPMLVAGAFYAYSSLAAKEEMKFGLFGMKLAPQAFAGIIFACLLVVAWPGAILWDESSFGTVISRLFALFAALAQAIPLLRKAAPSIREKFVGSHGLPLEMSRLISPATALLFAALLINLKRGPWMGIFVELAVIGFLLSRRLLFWSVALTFVLLLSLSPARTRMANMTEHFSISGGRKQMWELGTEIAQRFPMGLGANNARYMRELDPSIPQAHRHMHNNLLNVIVEAGWIGFSVYLWWMATVISYGLKLWSGTRLSKDRVAKQLGVFALCLSTALLGWQISGMVEYNFGDGEIRLIAFFYMGLLLAIGRFVSLNGRSAGAAAKHLR